MKLIFVPSCPLSVKSSLRVIETIELGVRVDNELFWVERPSLESAKLTNWVALLATVSNVEVSHF